MIRVLVTVLAVAAVPAPAMAQSIGPDLIVGAFYSGVYDWGSSGNVAAFSIGSQACNVGDQPAAWVSGNNQHPVIAQNIFRVRNGSFEQIGMGWLKHGFSAQQWNLCGGCQPSATPQALGPGCSDPYNASLNGNQPLLGPRSEVNPVTGFFPYPPSSPPIVDALIDRRIQIDHADLDPALNAGAVYFGELQYVSADDAAAGNQNNNASYKEFVVTPSGSTYLITDSGANFTQMPAMYGWQLVHPTVSIATEDIPGDGRFFIGHHAMSLGGGLTRHVYAVHNLNSDRSAGAFTVNLPGGTTILNPTFHDVHHHSGEPYDGTDWTPTITGSSISWSVAQPYAADPNGNAIRWGTCYTFSFESDQAPTGRSIDLFKPACQLAGAPTLTLHGDGSPNSWVGLDLLAVPSAGVVVATDTDPGPTSFGALGTVQLGFSSAFLGVADATGLYGGPTGNDATNACGYWSFGLNTGPPGFPSGLVVHAQAVVFDGAAPNGFFWISNAVTLSVP